MESAGTERGREMRKRPRRKTDGKCKKDTKKREQTQGFIENTGLSCFLNEKQTQNKLDFERKKCKSTRKNTPISASFQVTVSRSWGLERDRGLEEVCWSVFLTALCRFKSEDRKSRMDLPLLARNPTAGGRFQSFKGGHAREQGSARSRFPGSPALW
jgi:hypothetical protein